MCSSENQRNCCELRKVDDDDDDDDGGGIDICIQYFATNY